MVACPGVVAARGREWPGEQGEGEGAVPPTSTATGTASSALSPFARVVSANAQNSPVRVAAVGSPVSQVRKARWQRAGETSPRPGGKGEGMGGLHPRLEEEEEEEAEAAAHPGK